MVGWGLRFPIISFFYMITLSTPPVWRRPPDPQFLFVLRRIPILTHSHNLKTKPQKREKVFFSIYGVAG